MSLNLGPEGLSSIKFPELLGRRKANEMIFLESKLLAKEAAEYGFVNAVLPKDKAPSVDPVLTDISKIPGLTKLLSFDTKTVKNAKRLLLEG